VESEFGTAVSTVLLIGHEPAMSATALGLSDGSNTTLTQEISLKFPTSAVAVLQTGSGWHELGLGGAELVGFHVAR
jgi:phosphohistidine phosphatase